MEPKITNLDYLNEISAGNRQIILEMITIFNSEVPLYLTRMNQLVDTENWDSLGKLAHKAKASASIMGMPALARELKDLEQLILENADSKIYPSMIISIEKKFNAAMEELELISKTSKFTAMLKTEISGEIIICSFDQGNKLNAINSETAKKEVGKYFEEPDTRLILDLGNVAFIDSSGFGALLSIMKNARKNRGTFRLCNLTPDVKALFKLLQLYTIFEIFESREECLKSFT